MATRAIPQPRSSLDIETANKSCTKKSGKPAQDLEKQEIRGQCRGLEKIQSHHTGQDLPPIDIFAEAGDEIYLKFTPRRKNIIVFVLSFCAFLSPVSSTAVLSAVPEVASTFETTSSIINLTNALYLVSMGVCPLLFGPIVSLYGRRWVIMWRCVPKYED